MGIMDRELTFSLAQAVTATAASTDYYDQQVAGNILALAPMWLQVSFDEAATAAGAATVTVQLQCDDNPAFSSPKTVATSAALALADMAPGKAPVLLPLPASLDERYIRVNYVVATGPLTAGKFTSTITDKPQSNKPYPGIL